MAKMVTIQYFEAGVIGGSGITDPYMDSATKSKVDFMDLETGNHVFLGGDGFQVSHGLIDRGTITSLTHTSLDGDLFLKVTNLNIDARTVAGETSLEFIQDVLQRVANKDVKFIGTSLDDILTSYNGNDRVFGRQGDDKLDGDNGNDILVGGLGNDMFVFADGYGRDKITDFDADGGAGAQDLIDATFADVLSINQVGADTVINFGDGDKLTLLGIDKTHIDATDFV